MDSDDTSEEPVTAVIPLIEDDATINAQYNDHSSYWNGKERLLWGTALFVLTTLTYSCRNCMPISAFAMTEEFDWDKSETGLVLSSFFWGYVSTQIFSGLLSDRIGGDQVITMAAMVWGPLTIIYPYCAYAFEDKSKQLTFLVINRVIFGMVTAFHYPAMSNICATKSIEEKKTSLYAALDSGTMAGNMISGSIGSFLSKRYGWQVSFYVFGALATVWAISIRIFLMKRRCLRPCHGITKKVYNRHSDKDLSTKQVWAFLVKNKSFWAMVFCTTASANTTFLIFSWLPMFFEDQFPRAEGWVFNVLPWTLPIASSIGSGWLADRLIKSGFSVTTTRKFIQTVSSLSSATPFFFLGVTKCYVTALVLVTYATTMISFGTAGAYSNTQDLVPSQAGAVYGVMNSFGAIPGFLGVYVSGHILQYFNSWAAVFSLASGISLSGWLVYIILGTGERLI